LSISAPTLAERIRSPLRMELFEVNASTPTINVFDTEAFEIVL
jgi:hypothetical protein